MSDKECIAHRANVVVGRLKTRVRELERLLRASEEARTRAERERDELRWWVDDLQSGMYVNCVYCGHRYGPGDTTPVTMADALKAHVEQCPKHPMSALRAKLAAAEQERDALREHAKHTLEALAAARDVLAAEAKAAGWLPQQQAYSCTMTDSERRMAGAVASIDNIVREGWAALAGAPQKE
jgi:Zn ribbon nucleic-acid-binding protein